MHGLLSRRRYITNVYLYTSTGRDVRSLHRASTRAAIANRAGTFSAAIISVPDGAHSRPPLRGASRSVTVRPLSPPRSSAGANAVRRCPRSHRASDQWHVRPQPQPLLVRKGTAAAIGPRSPGLMARLMPTMLAVRRPRRPRLGPGELKRSLRFRQLPRQCCALRFFAVVCLT